MKRKINLLGVLFVCLLISAFSISSLIGGDDKNEKTADSKSTNKKEEIKVHNCGCQNNIADLAEKLIPAVVNISTTTVEERNITSLEDLFFGGMFPFDEFFGGRGKRRGSPGRKIKRKAYALGSGFFVDDNGHIVTNYHVVKDAEDIKITTDDKREFKAKVVGFDKKTDLAVIKISSKTKTPFVKFGKSMDIRIGDPIIAIGNPFGLGGTLTSGIISAKSRHMVDSPYNDFLQTDAAINKGNSGGPMFNMNGEVVGINTAIFSTSESGGNIGIGFAIPSDTVTGVVEQLKQNIEIKRGYLGIYMQEVNDDIAEAVGLKLKSGVFVNDVIKKGPADVGGIKSGDVILEFDGKAIKESHKLSSLVASTPIGKKVDVLVWRYSEKLKLSIVVGENKNDATELLSQNDKSGKNGNTLNVDGVVVGNLSKSIRDEFEIDDSITGVIVLDIKTNSMQGLKRGDVILAINQFKISSASDFKKRIEYIKSNKKNNFVIRINRNGKNIAYVTSLDKE